MDHLELPRRNILAYTMPGFATSTAPSSQARPLMRAVGATADEIDIRPSLQQMLKDIGHPFARAKRSTTSPSRTCRRASAPAICSGSPTARARWWSAPATSSELALGWCTYGVGDHMSHYDVNASVPKTLDPVS